MGKILLENLQELSIEFPAFVTNPRSLGLFAAFDLPSMTERDNLVQELYKNKLIILPSGDQSIRFRPHLNISENELSHGLEIIKNTLKSVLN